MTSTRLPGKILIPVGGKTMLQHHTDRLLQAGLPVYIATTTNQTDDPVATFAANAAITCYRGDEHNVLSRFYGCAKENKLDVVIRVTSDCPLIDGDIIADAVQRYLAQHNDQLYLSNALKRTYPRGFDFEIFSFKLLEEAYQNAFRPEELEHVTPYINQNKSGKVSFDHYVRSSDASAYRVTLDTPEDLELIRQLIENYQASQLNAEQIINLLQAHPELVLINAHIEQKKLGQ